MFVTFVFPRVCNNRIIFALIFIFLFLRLIFRRIPNKSVGKTPEMIFLMKIFKDFLTTLNKCLTQCLSNHSNGVSVNFSKKKDWGNFQNCFRT